jgi:hypothetical protein
MRNFMVIPNGMEWLILYKELLQANRIFRKNVLQPSKQFRRIHANEFSEHELIVCAENATK